MERGLDYWAAVALDGCDAGVDPARFSEPWTAEECVRTLGACFVRDDTIHDSLRIIAIRNFATRFGELRVPEPYFSSLPQMNASMRREIEAIWREAALARPVSMALQCNAACALAVTAPRVAVALARRCMRTLGGSERAAWLMAMIYRRHARSESRHTRARLLYACAYCCARAATALAVDEWDHWKHAPLLLEAAANAGLVVELEDAVRDWELRLADEEVPFAADVETAVYTARGLLALWRDDISAAEEELIRSVTVDPTPYLESYGPSWDLARALWEAGRHEVVIDAMRRCRELWPDGIDELDEAIAAATGGKTPMWEILEGAD